MGETVRLERIGTVALLTLNRPEAMNAINRAMRRDLAEAIGSAERDPEVRAIIVAGAGDRAFCAGVDIKEEFRPESLVTERDERQAPRWNDVLEATTKPTIAAVHGYCMGGGLEMALACDIRIAASDAVFALPEVGLGMIPGAGGTQRLPRVVGVGHALHLILSGDTIDADRALQIGLVTQLVPRAKLREAAMGLGEKLGARAPRAMAYAKEAVRRGTELPLREGLRLESDLATLLLTTEDRIEGASAFREKRSPQYQGR
jgi:enoyl-CoA hydratase/carnithine racemase